jgi:hypothetical protein
MAEHEEVFLAAADAEKFAATKHGGQVEHIGVVYVTRWDDTALPAVGGAPSNSADAAIAAARARK